MAGRGRVDERRVLGTVFLLGLPNLAGAVLVFLFQNVVLPGGPGESLRAEIGTFIGYVALSLPIAGFLGYLIIRPVLHWVSEDRAPTTSERDATVLAPRRMGAMGFAFWVGALIVFGALAVTQGDARQQIVRDGVATLLGGLTTAVLSFLLVESWLRPVVAAALAGRAPPHRRVAGIAPRILLSWGLGSGVPLLAIAMAQLDLGPETPRPSPEALGFLAALGLGTGAVMLALAARSVSAPIDAVRDALSRVREGDVDVVVPVDDAGQIGHLQAGFNEMVVGLRERRQLEDLFGRYVGPEVAADALERGAGLGGEQREASALFVDIIGSTDLAHTTDPREVVATLNDFFSAVVAVVTAEGGWVNKFEGDGALCVFGAPADQPDHATRALRAAREVTLALDTLRERRRPGLHARIGVSTGTVVAGHVGAVERFEYTVIGDAVNEAARLTEAAKTTAMHVLVSDASIAAADDAERQRWRPASRLQLRGRDASTTAYEPVTPE